jgi:hypothetical protein
LARVGRLASLSVAGKKGNTMKNDFGTIVMETTEVKAWEFQSDYTVDIEIWRNGNYVTTLTVSALTGAVLYNSKD